VSAELLFSGVSALASCIQVWQGERNAEAAEQTFDADLKSFLRSKEAINASRDLEAVVPDEVIHELTAAAARCWDRYLEILRNRDKYLPQEIDDATEAVKACVGRELNRLTKLGQKLPIKWKKLVNHYNLESYGRGLATI
jgi:hypothetical protein